MILKGDCFELIKKIPDNTIDLVITSPPYADIVNYGKSVSIKKPNDYVDWILPLFDEIYRILKPSGSFILNINDKIDTGKRIRNTFIFDMISRNNKETDLKLYDTYIWYKKSGIPNGSKKRFRNLTEYIFHFVKDPKYMKFYMDRVLEEPKNTTKSRYEYDIDMRTDVKEGKSIRKKRVMRMGHPKDGLGGTTNKYYYGDDGRKQLNPNYSGPKYYDVPNKVRPDNVFRFSTAGASRDNTIKHPAPFHKELPLYFINLLTDEGDKVLDPFTGIGTTNIAAQELNRKHLGIDLNETYCDFARKRLKGEELTTCGGFIWKKEKIN